MVAPAIRARLVAVRPPEDQEQERTPTAKRTARTRTKTPSEMVRAACILVCLHSILASSSSLVGGSLSPFLFACGQVVSSTGGRASANTTIDVEPSNTDGFVPGLTNAAAIGIVCGIVVLVCVCLFLAARHQMKATTETKRAGTGLSSRLQMQIANARRGWRKDGEGAGAAARVDYTNMSLEAMKRDGATAADMEARAAVLQREQMSRLGGASMGGLGACTYTMFRDPEDFAGEPWATEGTKEALRRTGCILDVVIVAQQTMYMCGLSGLVPLVTAVAIPFHKMILKKLKISDWYGQITEIDFTLCLAIACSGVVVHLAAYVIAKILFGYDRAPSIVEEKAAWRNAQTIQAMVAALPVPSPTLKLNIPMSPTSASPSITRDPLVSPTSKSPDSGSMGIVPVSPTTVAVASVAPVVAVGPPAFLGRDPPLWPLRLFCVVVFLSYGLLGFQGYISCDESVGRHYGFTSTSKAYWPPTAGRGPIITLIICIIVGGAMMVPMYFSLKLLALFHPRKVHPNLIHKYD